MKVFQYVVVSKNDKKEEIFDYGTILAADENAARVKIGYLIADMKVENPDEVVVQVRPF